MRRNVAAPSKAAGTASHIARGMLTGASQWGTSLLITALEEYDHGNLDT